MRRRIRLMAKRKVKGVIADVVRPGGDERTAPER